MCFDNKCETLIIDKVELENVRSISENTTNISTSDSTTKSVISGYYSGPSMMTVKPKKRSINKLKQLIDM
jgi:hypothetical protein